MLEDIGTFLAGLGIAATGIAKLVQAIRKPRKKQTKKKKHK